MEDVLNGTRCLRVSHSIITVDAMNLQTRSYSLAAEYHVRVSNSTRPETPTTHASKALGLSFLLPDGDVVVEQVTMNGETVEELSPQDELGNQSHFGLSFVAFPESANTESLGAIFARLCENRRDLISYEEVTKAHRAASLSSSFGLLVKVPPANLVSSELLILKFRMSVQKSQTLFREIGLCGKTLFAPIGQVWFPVPAGLMLLPSGLAATAQPIEHQRHRVTLHANRHAFLHADFILPTGDPAGNPKIASTWDSPWVSPHAVGLFVGHGFVEEKSPIFHAHCEPQLLPLVQKSLSQSLVGEILQVIGTWFPSHPLPPISLLFLPLPVQRDFWVFGTTLVIDSGLLADSGFDQRIPGVLAEAVASLWIARALPSFSDLWIPVGLAGMLAERFVEFHQGANECQHRLLAKRARFHALVERGLDWRPLPVIGDVSDPLLRLKSGLVFECLRRSVVNDSDLRSSIHELASKKGPPISTDAFFYHLTCSLGQHTEAGAALPQFREEWVQSVGVPLIHVGFSIVDKKRFFLNVSQAPLQRISCHDNVPLCSVGKVPSGCSCGQDFVSRTEGASYMRPHAQWGAGRRRIWNGEIEVSIYRSSVARVTAKVTMDSSASVHSTQLTVPFVCPRKHEIVLHARAARDDELVHGWLCVLDDRWLLAKIVLCQSPLMWANQLQLSRNLTLEMTAIEALQHVRGSLLVQEALVDTLSKPVFNFRVRMEAGKALLHLAVGCGEREALGQLVAWIEANFCQDDSWANEMDPKEIYTFLGAAEHLAYAKRSLDRRDHKSIASAMLACVKSIERGLTLRPTWRADLAMASAIKFALMVAGDTSELQAVFQSVDLRLRSDMYGSPLASADLAVTEGVLCAAPANGAFVASAWPYLCESKFLESLAVIENNRKLSRTAIRAYLSVMVGLDGAPPESESAWTVRFRWIQELTVQIEAGSGMMDSLHVLGWLVDCWELVLERCRRDTGKSPLSHFLQKPQTCDLLWNYLTRLVPLLPPACRSQVQHSVHAIYLHAYGTSVPPPYRELVDKERADGRGPLSFWLPFRDHEKIYRRFLLRGTTLKAEPRPVPGPKKPRLLITGQGSVPLTNDPATLLVKTSIK